MRCRLPDPDSIPWDDLWRIVAAQFPLGARSLHGPAHWKRVERNGLIVAAPSGADETVVRLFSLFHDSRRKNESIDPGHGVRGGGLAIQFREEKRFTLSVARMELLLEACRGHTDGETSGDPTIGACWDADRLDLARVGTTPDVAYLSTEKAKEERTIREAVKRSLDGARRRKRR